MKYTKKLLFTWIAFHGITDIFLCTIWMPVYFIIVPMSIYIPSKILNIPIIILSINHFSKDLIFLTPYENYIITILLSLGIYYRKKKIAQDLIKSYLSLIHVPNHLYKIEYDMNISFILFITFIAIYNIEPLLIEMDKFIKKIDDSEVNMKRKLLYGVIISHTISDI